MMLHFNMLAVFRYSPSSPTYINLVYHVTGITRLRETGRWGFDAGGDDLVFMYREW